MQISGFAGMLPGTLCTKPEYLIAVSDFKQPAGPPPITLDTYKMLTFRFLGGKP